MCFVNLRRFLCYIDTFNAEFFGGFLGMGIFNKIKTSMGKALGTEQLKKQTEDVKNLANVVFEKKEAKMKESFEEALNRLNLSENDIQNRAREFKRLVKVFIFIIISLLLYLIYAIFQKAWIACLGTMGIILVAVAQLFRYHFWLYQIEQKRLGCTYSEWYQSLFHQSGETTHEQNNP
jgi:intracellular multiplication protein IcmV